MPGRHGHGGFGGGHRHGGGFGFGGGRRHHHGGGFGFLGGPPRRHFHRGPGPGVVLAEAALAGAATAAVVGAATAPRRDRTTYVYERRPAPAPAPVVVYQNTPPPPPAQQPQAFMIDYIGITSGERQWNGEDKFVIQVGAIDGANYTITRSFENFNTLQRSTHSIARTRICTNYPHKRTGLFAKQANVEEQRIALNMWLVEMVDKAQSLPGLQAPLYGFLDFHAQYTQAAQRALEQPHIASVAPPVAATPVEATAVYDATRVGLAGTAEAAGATASNPPTYVPPSAAAAAAPAGVASNTQQQISAANPFAVSAANPFVQAGESKADEWEVAPYFEEYQRMFNQYGPVNGRLSPNNARDALMTTGVSTDILRDIWELADRNRDGTIDVEEFAVAMYLCQQVKDGKPLVRELPFSMIPPSQKR